MRKSVMGLVTIGAVGSMVLSACGSSNSTTKTANGGGGSSSGSSSSAKPAASKTKIGVILPDSKSSVRWETADRKYLKAAFDAAGVQSDIQNAQGDKTQFQTIADQMITGGVNVLMIVNLDSGSGAAVLKKAKAAGVATIDYDRLTLGGGAQYYVSFDNVSVGTLQGEGLIKCLGDSGKKAANYVDLNGSPTDNNATLFKQGYDAALAKAPQYKKVADQSVPDWDNAQGGTIFEQMYTRQKGKIDGVLAANDGLGNAAVTVLKKNHVQVPVTGQDATVQGLQNVLNGDQCMTVYKAVKKEADAASMLAIALAKGNKPSVSGSVMDTQTKQQVPSELLKPQAIYKANVKDVVTDGFVTAADLCTGAVAAKCKAAGIS